MGDTTAAADIRRLLDLLDICTDIVTARGLIHDTALPLVALTPISDMVRADDRIYRHHVGELCTRWAARRRLSDLDHMTSAELLLEFSRVSLTTPLNPIGTACYGHLFAEVLPGALPEVDGIGRESYPGEAQDEIARLKRRKFPRPRCGEIP